MNKAEKWEWIGGYEGLYKVSNFGRIKSFVQWNGKRYVKKERILKGWINKPNKKYKYQRRKIKLTKKGEKEECFVHQIVAKTFIPNPNNFTTINHIDGNALNNNVNNLEWCTAKHNVNHAISIGLKKVFNLPLKELYQLYIVENKTPKEIGKMYHVTEIPVRRLIHEYGIKKDTTTKYQISEEWLISEIKNGKTNKELAKEKGCDPSLISKYKNRIIERGYIYAK